MRKRANDDSTTRDTAIVTAAVTLEEALRALLPTPDAGKAEHARK